MQPAVIGLLILALCVVLFITNKIPAVVTGCLGCLLMVLTKAAPYHTAFSGFSSSIVLLMTSAMIVGIAMFRTGAAQVIGRFVLKYSGNEKKFLLSSCIVFGLLSLFLANTALLAAYFPVADSVCRASDMKRRNLVLPVCCAIMLGGQSTLVGCTPQLTANALMSRMTGVEMGMWSLTAPGLCLFAVYLLYLWFWGYSLGNKIWGDRPEAEMNVDLSVLKALSEARYDKKKLTIMFAITALMLVSYVFGLLPTAETAMCAAMLCVLTKCCSTKDIVREMPWEVVIFLAACLGLADSLTASGADELLGLWLAHALGNVTSPFVIFAVMVTLTLVMSQFLTNSTAIIVVTPLALELCEQYGFSALPFTLGITMAASVACCTPLAAAQITMTGIAGYEFLDYLKYGFVPSLLFLAGICVFVPLFYALV